MNQIGIETSRHVRLSYKPAHLIYRIFAWMIDALLYVVYIVAFMWIWGGVVPSDIIGNLNVGWIQTMALYLPYFIYFPLLETVWNGRTVGKKIIGLRVTRIDGTRASVGSYLIRWLFRFFEITVTGGVVAILTILINGRGQRLGDMVANTCVISEEDNRQIQDQIFSHTKLEREVMFDGAAELSDKDISVVRNLLNSGRAYSPEALNKLMARTREVVEKKTGAVNSELTDEKYLKTIIKDYYTIYGSKSE